VPQVAVISPHPVVVEGFRAMLGRHPGRIAVARDDEPVAEVDVILYDVLGLVDADGADLDRLVGHPRCVVLAVGRDLCPPLLDRATARGVDGSVSAAIGHRELVALVERALAERGEVGDAAVPAATSSQPGIARTADEVSLTRRQAEMIALLVAGYSNKEIARRSSVSVNSVKTHLRSAYRKLGVRSRAEAAVWAVRQGLVPEPGPADD